MSKKIYLWVREKLHTPYATVIFAGLSFIEAFFFMPVTTLLTIYGVEWPRRAYFYATIVTCASIIGSICAYGFGSALAALGAGKILNWLVSTEQLAEFAHYCTQHEFLLASIGSFLPSVPLKVITLPAGFCGLPFLPFIAAIALGRFVRFFGLASAIYVWGNKIQHLIDRYFTLFVICLILLLVATFWILHG